MDLNFRQIELLASNMEGCDPRTGSMNVMRQYIEMLELELESLKESNVDMTEKINELENAMDEAAAKYDKYVPSSENPKYAPFPDPNPRCVFPALHAPGCQCRIVTCSPF